MSQPLTFTAPTMGHITGRNGTFHLSGLVVDERGDRVSIDGVGKSGRIVNGGLLVSAEAFARIAAEFLAAQGWTVQPPTEVEPRMGAH